MLLVSYLFIEPKSRTKSDVNIYAHIKEAVKLFIQNRKLRLLSVISMISFSIGEIKWEFSSAFTAMVWPIWAIGIARTLPSFGASISFFYSGKLIRKFNKVKILLFESIMGKTISLIAYVMPTIFSPIILSTTSLFYGVGSVAKNTLMQAEFSDHQRATMSSLNSLGGSIGFAIMSIFLGGMADAIGPTKALIILTIISLPIVYLYYLLFKNDRKALI